MKVAESVVRVGDFGVHYYSHVNIQLSSKYMCICGQKI